MIQQAESWFNTFLPRGTRFQKTIYSEYLAGLKQYYRDHGAPPEMLEDESFWLSESVRYFYPVFELTRSPFHIPGIDTAVDIFREIWQQQSKPAIVIYGDRDVDGVSSSSILYRFLRYDLKHPPDKVHLLVPGVDDRYGITEQVIERINSYEPDILITMDCGSSDADVLNAMKEAFEQRRLIIFDHHFLPASEEDYPAADAFINPKRLPNDRPERHLCTASLAVKFIEAFTFSFTSEYNRVSLIRSESEIIFEKNGVMIEPVTDSALREVSFIKDRPAAFEAAVFWQKLASSDRNVHLIDRFLKAHPQALSVHEKFRILQWHSLKKLRQKLRPYFVKAALGTVADIMPLAGDNRIYLNEGLQIHRNEQRLLSPGLRELFRTAGLLSNAFESDYAFTVCPMINAAGRLGRAADAARLFAVDDPSEAAEAAFKLKSLNNERKKLSEKALSVFNLEDFKDDAVIILHHPDIHRGISGPVASKVAEAGGRPAIVLVDDGDCLRGSIRAATNENVFDFLMSLSHLLIQCGGHRQAAGFSLSYEKKDEFIKTALESAAGFFREHTETIEERYPVYEVKDHEIRPEIWRELEIFAPYGHMNPHPVLSIKPTLPVEITPMGSEGAHARLDFKGVNFSDIEGVWFFHNNLIHETESSKSLFAAEPHINFFRGRRKLQLKIKKVDALPKINADSESPEYEQR